MPYDEKTQEILLPCLDEILSEAEEDLLIEDFISEVEEENILSEAEIDVEYDFSDVFLDPISEPIGLAPESDTSVPGMGVYQITTRKKVKNTVANAAIRHLRRSCRLLKRLEAHGNLSCADRETLEEIQGFLVRNQFI